MPLYGMTDIQALKTQTEGDNLSNVITLHKAALAR
jgi:hypothetical protein